MAAIIRNAPFVAFLAMVLLPLGLAAAAGFVAWRAGRQARLLARTPGTLIAMTTDGYRHLRGQVEAVAGQTLRAPLTGARCCWFEARVERWTRATPTSDQCVWETVREVTSSAPLLVRDATGCCAVRVEGAEVTPTDRSQWTGSTLEPKDRNPPRHGTAGAPTSRFQIGGKPESLYRYTEARIYAGDPLLVLGRFSDRRFEARDDRREERGDPRAAAHTPFEIGAGGPGEPLILSTAGESAHTAMVDMRREAGVTVAVALLALVALILYTRVG